VNAKRRAASLLLGLLLVACAGTPTSPPTPGPSPTLVTMPGPTAPPRSATPPSAAPTLTAPSPTPPGPTSSPTVTAQLPGSSPTPATLPVRAGTVSMAPGPDGGLYVLVVDQSATQPSGPGSRSVLALLDAQGRPRAGWPIALVGWACSSGYWYWPLPVTAADGSVRLVCSAIIAPGEPVHSRAFAFDSRGRSLAGWPVDLPDQVSPSQASVVGDALVVMAQEVGEWDEASAATCGELFPIGQSSGVWWLVSVAADGTLRVGGRHEVPDAEGYGFPQLGPEGIAYQLAYAGCGTKIRTLAFDADGWVSPVASGEVPIWLLGTYSGAGPSDPAVLVAADGAAFLLGEDERTVYGLDPSGQTMAGWPYQADRGPQWRGSCPADVTGCGVDLSTAAVGPGDVLYLPQASRSSRTGGGLVAIGPDGRVRPGWPVVLTRPGAEFWSIVARSDGTVYALAIEPEAGERSSATILAIGPDGRVRYRVTVVEP